MMVLGAAGWHAVQSAGDQCTHIRTLKTLSISSRIPDAACPSIILARLNLSIQTRSNDLAAQASTVTNISQQQSPAVRLPQLFEGGAGVRIVIYQVPRAAWLHRAKH